MKITSYKGGDLDKSFKSYARRQIKLIDSKFSKIGGEVVKASIGFYYFSGFAKINGQFVYFSISDVRHSNMTNKLLIRKCRDENDYSGERNCYLQNYQWEDFKGLNDLLQLTAK